MKYNVPLSGRVILARVMRGIRLIEKAPQINETGIRQELEKIVKPDGNMPFITSYTFDIFQDVEKLYSSINQHSNSTGALEALRAIRNKHIYLHDKEYKYSQALILSQH